MDCAHVAEHHMADRYVLHQLTAEEAERFEDHYMSCDACLGELEHAEVMARGFKRMGAEETAKVAVAVAAATGGWRRRAWRAVAAAVVVAGLAVPMFLSRAPRSDDDGVRINPPVVYLQPERSTGTPGRVLRLPADRGAVVLVLELDPPLYPSYRAEVTRDGREVWEGRDLELGERDTVTLSLGAGLLSPGDHQLWLRTVTPAGQEVSVARFGFQVLEGGR